MDKVDHLKEVFEMQHHGSAPEALLSKATAVSVVVRMLGKNTGVPSRGQARLSQGYFGDMTMHAAAPEAFLSKATAVCVK